MPVEVLVDCGNGGGEDCTSLKSLTLAEVVTMPKMMTSGLLIKSPATMGHVARGSFA